MNIEKGGDSRNQEEGFDVKFIRSMFAHARLDHDVYNVWHKLPFNEEQWHGPIEPLQHYVERIERDAKNAALIRQLSDPEAVKAYDQLVDEFNASLPEINKTKDFDTIRKFWDRARKLIYSERE